ncbi:MAG: hypothetical protein J0H04_12055 [Hyphomicrobium denitrificans]|nr:hypothetical protein [Hyphomicrobium denitrificans]
MKIARILFVGLMTASLGGCGASLPKLSTGSLFGANQESPIDRNNDPATRTMDVAATSARAIKCGYNFDAPRLKNTYLSHEASLGVSADQVSQADKIYNVAYNGVTKAAAEDPNYCSDRKTQTIKADLGRLLAGDFEPPPKKVVAKQDGIFDGWFDSSGEDKGPKFGSGDWWDSQKEKAGN